MSTDSEREWESWAREWRSEEGEGSRSSTIGREEIERRVRRQSRRLRLLVFVDALVVSVFLALSAWMAIRIPDPLMIVWAAAVWVFTFVALAFTIRNRRGIWAASAETTRAYLELSLERCRRKVRTARFGMQLLTVEIVFLLLWGTWEIAAHPERLSERPGSLFLRYGLIALFAAGTIAWATLYRRSAVREMDRVEEIRRTMD
jgi:hypothetical protein